jgi:DNA modification methylase
MKPSCAARSPPVAAIRESRQFIGIEKDARYVRLARRRIDAAAPPV